VQTGFWRSGRGEAKRYFLFSFGFFRASLRDVFTGCFKCFHWSGVAAFGSGHLLWQRGIVPHKTFRLFSLAGLCAHLIIDCSHLYLLMRKNQKGKQLTPTFFQKF
jgi:hypothetical protein